MRSTISNQKARREASMAAARALVQLRVDASQPIDIFKIIQDQGIWLMFSFEYIETFPGKAVIIDN